jgi:hypothetical protein
MIGAELRQVYRRIFQMGRLGIQTRQPKEGTRNSPDARFYRAVNDIGPIGAPLS